MSFVDVPIESDASTLADNAVERLQAEWEGWEPNDGDLEVVLIEALAPMAQNAAEVASQMPAAALRGLGDALLGVPFSTGEGAATTVTFRFVDTQGYVLPAGFEVSIDGFAFATNEDVAAAAGSDTAAGISVTATTVGVDANDLPGATVVPLTDDPSVISVSADAPPRGGTDPDTDEAYQDRIARQLRLASTALVTTSDYELAGLDVTGVSRIRVVANTTTRTITAVPWGDDGLPVASSVKTDLAAVYAAGRLVTWTVTVTDPTYTTINVTYTVHPYPGYDPTDLTARINAMLSDWLSPASFGQVKNLADSGTQAPLESRVRVNKLIDLIGDVDGVDYVSALTLTSPAGGVQSNGDVLMSGTVPLPHPGTFTGTVS